MNRNDTKDKEYDANKRIINIVVFDKRAETLANLAKPGAMVAVTGPVREEEYNGNVSYRMSARGVGMMKFAPLAAGEDNPAGPAPAGSAAAVADGPAPIPSSEFMPMEDEEGELPF